MNYTSDTWFFHKLIEEDSKAIELWKEIVEEKGRLIVPTVVITEFVKKCLSKNFNKELEEILSIINYHEKISIINLTKEIAELAGKLGYTFKMTPIDSIILATAVATGNTNIITADPGYQLAEKQGKIKIVRW